MPVHIQLDSIYRAINVILTNANFLSDSQLFALSITACLAGNDLKLCNSLWLTGYNSALGVDILTG